MPEANEKEEAPHHYPAQENPLAYLLKVDPRPRQFYLLHLWQEYA